MAAETTQARPRIVIVGGGIIGCTIAYYLAKRGQPSIVIEKCEVACGASGKAGGFLARDWSKDTDLDQLSRMSFDLHSQLAEALSPNGEYGYRKVDSFSVDSSSSTRPPKQSQLDWFDGFPTKMHQIGAMENTAQVHPQLFSQTMMNEAIRLGAELQIAQVTGVQINQESQQVTGVFINENELIPAETVILSMGPWTHEASSWLNVPNITGRKAQSVVFNAELPAQACFVSFTDESGVTHDPEVYPRPDGTVFVCGACEQTPLPSNPTEIAASVQESEQLESMARNFSRVLSNAPVITRQACYLPVNKQGGLPAIGAVPGVKGAYIAAGHSCWGILNAPATGLAMAELVLEGRSSSVDLSMFDPSIAVEL